MPCLLWHFCSIFLWKILLANNIDPDQMPHYVGSDVGLHCLPMTLLRVTKSEWVKCKTHILPFKMHELLSDKKCRPRFTSANILKFALIICVAGI